MPLALPSGPRRAFYDALRDSQSAHRLVLVGRASCILRRTLGIRPAPHVGKEPYPDVGPPAYFWSASRLAGSWLPKNPSTEQCRWVVSFLVSGARMTIIRMPA